MGLFDRNDGQRRGVRRGPELDRILALPRRRWEELAPNYVEKVSSYLRAPGGTQMLRPVQAAALVEAHDCHGMFGSIRVGGGKTAISLLTFTVMGAKRPLLLVPAKLKDKTLREMQALRKNWLVPGYVRVVSYELLGREQSATLLDDWNPDVIVMDECHKCRNRAAAVTRRVGRYIESHEDVRVVAMSGTITKRSIKDYAHIVEWCLRDLTPAPRDFQTIVEWGMALDEQRDGENQLTPGALMELCNDEERSMPEPIRAARRAYGRRVAETPGVIATQEGALGTSLSIEALPLYDSRIDAAAAHMRLTWERPDGEPMMDGIELWRHLREVACGFFYRWVPPPPRPWLDSRRAWAKCVREILRNNRRGIDSSAQVMRAVDAGQYPVVTPILQHWRAMEPLYTPQTEAVWVSTAVLERAAAWAKEEKGIVWVEHTEFGRELERLSGLPFYWRQGRNKDGRPIEDHPPGEPLIASIASNAEGRNLQAWNTNLIVSFPPTGAIAEQLIARTHRDGQLADEVSATIVAALPEQLLAFDRARNDARMISDTTRQEQKLCYADVIIPEFGPDRDAMFAHAKAAKHS
jgi:hypothetical protein